MAMGVLKNRIRRLERKAGIGDKMELTIRVAGIPFGKTNPEMDFERLRERFGFKGFKPDVPAFVTHIETGVDGVERVRFSHPLVQSDLKNNQDISRGSNG